MPITASVFSSMQKKTLFLSHRGESDDAPENTLAAYQLAMDRDSDGMELDVRLTANGKVVCCHDANLLRVAESNLIVAESTLEELQRVHPVPEIAEVLAILKPGKHLQIELKGDDLALIPALKQVLNHWNGDLSQLAVSSFEEKTIQAAASAFPDLPRIILVQLDEKFGVFPSAEQTMEYLKELNCTGVSFKADFSAEKSFVRKLQKKGFRVVCWGVKTDELGLAMAAAGVDALTCNHAVALRRKTLGNL